MKFETGLTCLTRGVADRVAEDAPFAKFVYDSLTRHIEGDWGDLDEHDRNENELALNQGNLRLFSAYESEDGLPKIWIITEADRSVTTVLFPDEY